MNKIISAGRLKKIISRLRKKGRKIVFTNGCFDVLHSGHVKLFFKAKSLGNVLVVGLNSDASVKRLKGENRPLQPMRDRAVILSALEPVDYIVSFSEDTPDRLIRELMPDILVKGADYKKNEIVGREHVKKVVRIKLQKGRSTTGIIKKMKVSQR